MPVFLVRDSDKVSVTFFGKSANEDVYHSELTRPSLRPSLTNKPIAKLYSDSVPRILQV